MNPAADTSPAPAAGAPEVWVFGELTDAGRLAPVVRELLGVARQLAAVSGARTAVVLIGSELDGAVREAVAAGADRVYRAAAPGLARFDDVVYTRILARLVAEQAPAILLGGATAIGRALLPRVAVAVRTGLTADCTQLEIGVQDGHLLQTRPAFGGNLLATIRCETCRPQMATVRPGVFPLPPLDPGRTGEVVPVPVPDARCAPSFAWLHYHPRGAADVDLRSAEVIVTAGYGTGGPKGVALVGELAAALGGVLGASRAVVDAGWAGYPHQVGQTGTTVQPKLYVACGVSGAIQHIVGMQNSETIVAINRDPEAPIFRFADVAIVGDLGEVIPELLRQLAARGAGR